MRVIFIFIICGALTGCNTYSSNMRVGGSHSGVSLSDQRDAIKTVLEYDTLPKDAVRIGEVEASRCHRMWTEKPPTQDNLILDLKVAAYAKGADGITNIKIERQSGLSKNCWHILDGSATMIQMNP